MIKNVIINIIKSSFSPTIISKCVKIYYRYSYIKYKIINKKNNEIFNTIYDLNIWNCHESRSGEGSTLQNTNNIRRELLRIIDEYQIHSILDAPCGDLNWIREVNLHVDIYYGADIVGELIKNNNSFYGSNNKKFLLLDITNASIPTVDLILCRDCLQHLSMNSVISVLSNFNASSSTYLLATTFPSTYKNFNIGTGDFFPYNLCLPPFNLQPPIEIFLDYTNNYNPHMALWKIN